MIPSLERQQSGKFLKMLSMELPCDSAVSLLGVYPREMKTDAQAKAPNMNVHLFIIHDSSEVLRPPSDDEG